MNFRTNALARACAGVLVAVAVSACASTEYSESSAEEGLGSSVRHVVEAQKANPEASRNPDPNPINAGDGVRLEPVLEAYRTDTGARDNVERDILIDISE